MARWCTADSSSAKVWTTGTVSEHQVFGQGGTMLGIGQIGPTKGNDAQFGVPEPWPSFCARGSGQAPTFLPRHLLPHSDIVQDVRWLFVCGFSPSCFVLHQCRRASLRIQTFSLSFLPCRQQYADAWDSHARA